MNPDRRLTEHERRGVARVRAVFAVKSITRGRVQLAQAQDVSLAGLTLRRPDGLPLAPGTDMVITFALPGYAALLRLSARVVSDCLEGSFRRTGLRFVALAVDQQQQIVRFCQERLQERLQDRLMQAFGVPSLA